MDSPFVIPLAAFALVVIIIGLLAVTRIREKELEVHQRVSEAEMEHRRKMAELQMDLDRLLQSRQADSEGGLQASPRVETGS